jgi:hypothetical protein
MTRGFRVPGTDRLFALAGRWRIEGCGSAGLFPGGRRLPRG